MDIRLLFVRNADGDLSRVPIVAEVPLNELLEINDEIKQAKEELKSLQIEMKSIKHEPEIRNDAAKCLNCNLCMVCAGNHRRYESWPPGTGQCFCTMQKGGKPIQENPCSLCEEHDKELRDLNRSNRQALSRESRLKNKYRSLISKRRDFFKQHEIKAEVISE